MPKIVFDDVVRDCVNLGGIFKELRDWCVKCCERIIELLFASTVPQNAAKLIQVFQSTEYGLQAALHIESRN